MTRKWERLNISLLRKEELKKNNMRVFSIKGVILSSLQRKELGKRVSDHKFHAHFFIN